MKTRLALLTLAGLLTAGLLVLRPRAEPAQATTPAAAAPGRPNIIAAAGRVEPLSEEIKIAAELDGKLAQVLVDEGDTVKRGRTIAILSNGEYQARIALAQAAVREAEADRLRLVNGTRDMERREAVATVREAEAQVDYTRTERARREQLLAKGAISRTEFDTVDREYRVALAKLDAVRERRSFVAAEAREDEVLRADARIARARAELREAEALLGKTILRSPIDGVVLRRYRRTGESVLAGNSQPVVSLGDITRLRVRADIDEADVAKIAVGQPAYVTAEAYSGRRFTGRIIRIGQILGRKNIRTDEPTERVDTKILETLIALDPGQQLPVGLRVDAFVEVPR